MNSKERLKALKELGGIFNLDNLKDIRNLKTNIYNEIEDMENKAYSLPRNPCLAQGMCACTGACMTDEAKYLLEKAEKLREIYYKT